MSDENRPRRFGRRRTNTGLEVESILALRAELLLLREENARLKTAPHRGVDVGSVLGRARSFPDAAADDDIADETTRVLVEGLVIRESLLELCHEIERAMVASQARLSALQPPASVNGDDGRG